MRWDFTDYKHRGSRTGGDTICAKCDHSLSFTLAITSKETAHSLGKCVRGTHRWLARQWKATKLSEYDVKKYVLSSPVWQLHKRKGTNRE